jgi:hypothetical protein
VTLAAAAEHRVDPAVESPHNRLPDIRRELGLNITDVAHSPAGAQLGGEV